MTPGLGCCYYPEHWPERIWADDARRMADLGLSWVRIGEFAWGRIEPAPGAFAWDWLDRAILTLRDAGLKIVLGTPTATPPRWMMTKHPDMVAVDVDGRPRRFGSRRHYCFSHRGYRREATRIVSLLADRYGAGGNVAAWQVDNEYGCHDTVISYSTAARDAFRAWLEARYGSVEALNAAWGNVFWSMEYGAFDEIELPNLTVTEPNPAHAMAFRRFASDEVVAFSASQVEVLRARTDAPVIHNYMGRETAFDHYDVGADLDVAAWDSYPLGFLSDRLEGGEDHKRRYLRQGDPDMQAFHHDLYRGVGRGRWWIMEQQPGPVNWAPHNPTPLPGMVRLWTWEAIAHGAEAVLYFRWRQTPMSQEQYHAGLLRPDGIPAPAYEEARQVACEINDLGAVEASRSPVALIFDYTAAWAIDVQPQGADITYFDIVFTFYRALRRAGVNVDIVPPRPEVLGDRRLIFAPGLVIVPGALRTALAGLDAEIVLGPRVAAKNEEMTTPTPLPPDWPGLDATVMHVDTVPPFERIVLELGGSFRSWFEHFDGRDVIERTADGAPAVMGRPGLRYLAGWPDDTAADRFVTEACDRAGIDRVALPEGVRLRDAGPRRFVFNYAPDPVSWGDLTLPPAGVAWFDRKG